MSGISECFLVSQTLENSWSEVIGQEQQNEELGNEPALEAMK